MTRISFIAVPSMVGIVCAVDEKVWYFFCFYRQACTQRNHAGIALTQWSKNGFFRPAGPTHFSDKHEIWHGVAFGGQSIKPTFLNHNGDVWLWREGADLGLPLPRQIW